MRKMLNQWLFRLVRHLHKKSELQLQEMKRQKLHGSPEYLKTAGQERKLRNLKKALQVKVESPKASKTRISQKA